MGKCGELCKKFLTKMFYFFTNYDIINSVYMVYQPFDMGGI